VYGDFISGFTTLDGSATFADDLFAAKNLPDAGARAKAYTEIQRRWAENYMLLSMLAYAANPVVGGAKVQGMNVKALGNHRCYMDQASV
jgi:peptide/nickel transport system substrate-binding protein